LDANPSTSEESAHPKAVTAHRRVVRASGSVWSKGKKKQHKGSKKNEGKNPKISEFEMGVSHPNPFRCYVALR